MSYRNIAFVGKARSGKDTAAERLVQRYAFTRVAFADPLKTMALKLDPWVSYGEGLDWGPQYIRLSTMVEHVGWERAKDEYPEVRRILQHLGESVRAIDEDFWVRTAMRSIDAAALWNMPIVVTDCRYPNEAEALRERGFMLVRVARPVIQEVYPDVASLKHDSETALDDFAADHTVHNVSTLSELHAQVDALVKRR